ncbi:MAG: FAD-binding oxidoreductase [Rhizobiales bacterium]|nr:FAD-binding oxidoreductase [Hyphomicrobiales bacterium]
MKFCQLDTVVIGGGIVGLSTAIGLLQAGLEVTILDGADSDLRASHGNFGLIWLQGKGAQYGAYAKWTSKAVNLWPEFAKLLNEETGVDVSLRQQGGYELFTDEGEFSRFANELSDQQKILGADFEYEIMNGSSMRKKFPKIGPGLVGATFSPHCGDVNPLKLLTAMRIYFSKLGGRLISEFKVSHLLPFADEFIIKSPNNSQIIANRVVLCAGLGTTELGKQLGFKTEVHSQRGQLLITEKILPTLPFTSSTLRQVDEGGIQVGGTNEVVQYDDRETVKITAKLAHHAVTIFPSLKDVKIIRSWAALRVQTPDGYPVYAKSPLHKNAFLITCHSGVTLAAVHTDCLASWILDKNNAPDLGGLDETRFAL